MVETVFNVCAVLGGGLFVARLLLMLLGGDQGQGEVGAAGDVGDVGDGDIGDVGDVGDAGDVGDVDADGDGVADDAADGGIKLLSFQSMMAFLMLFGLVGRAMLHTSGAGSTIAIVVALGAGIGAAYISAKLVSLLLQLQSSGTVNFENAVGEQGTVYLTIKTGQTGKVQVPVQGRFMEVDAVASDPEAEIKTGERIRVRRVVRGNVLVVTKVE